MPKIQAIKKAQLTGHKASVFALGAAAEPNHFLSAAGDGWIVSWNLDEPETGRLVAQVESRRFALQYLPEWNKLVVGNMNGGVHWIALDEQGESRDIAHHKKGVFAILHAGQYVFTAGGEGMLTRWDPQESSLESYHLSNQSLRCLAYSPARREIAVGASDNAIYLLDADTLEIRHRQPDAHDNSVFSAHYTPDARYLLTGSRDAHLKVWELGDGLQPYASQPAHWFTINSIAFHPKGHWFATASRDKVIKIWDTRTFQLLKVLNAARNGGHINSVNCLYWHPHQQLLISAGDDRSIILWEIAAASR